MYSRTTNMITPREILVSFFSMIFNNMTASDWIYLAGFIDGDGSLNVQIVKRKDYLYGFQIRAYISLYQKSKYNWFLEEWQKKLGRGSISTRKNGMSELTILGDSNVTEMLHSLVPHLLIKKNLAKLVLNILEKKELIKNRNDFLEVCLLIDKIVVFNNSKLRKIDSLYVKKEMEMPVETK